MSLGKVPNAEKPPKLGFVTSTTDKSVVVVLTYSENNRYFTRKYELVCDKVLIDVVNHYRLDFRCVEIEQKSYVELRTAYISISVPRFPDCTIEEMRKMMDRVDSLERNNQFLSDEIRELEDKLYELQPKSESDESDDD